MKNSDDKQVGEETENVTAISQPDPKEEWRVKYLRVLADYQNLDRQSRTQREEMQKYAAETVLRKLLPVFDNFILAGVHIKDAGFELALKELSARLSELGVVKIEVNGRHFDPLEMECVEVVSGEKDVVASEVRAGYKLYDRVLRVAQVKVGGKEINQSDKSVK